MPSLVNMLKPLKLGAVTIPNRFLMAPLTRSRANEAHVPQPMMVKHYADRATAGLIIAEATCVTSESAFYTEPGIYTEEQVEAWKAVTAAVHAKGGLIFLQLYHPGRAAHSSNNNGVQPVAPSALREENHSIPALHNKTGEKAPYEMPRALRDDELPGILQAFVAGARNAIRAGFDGVELHFANGYLIDEFLKDNVNHRPPPYGGSLENRLRFPMEVAEAVCNAVGADRVGLRISPLNSYNGMKDSDPEALTRALCAALSPLHLAYLHVMRADFFGQQHGDAIAWARESYTGGVIVGNIGYSAEEAEAEVGNGRVDAVAFGTKFLANPDFVARCTKGLPLNDVREEGMYGGTEVGYNDYPFA